MLSGPDVFASHFKMPGELYRNVISLLTVYRFQDRTHFFVQVGSLSLRQLMVEIVLKEVMPKTVM